MKDKLLDRFLFEIKRDVERTKSRAPVSPDPPEVSIYANPDNWYSTRVVELVCRTLEGDDESLGFFQEERHRISLSARRLRPCACETGGLPGTLIPGLARSMESSLRGLPDRVQEVVRGEHWLHPKEKIRIQDTPQEIEALQKLFLELIGEA